VVVTDLPTSAAQQVSVLGDWKVITVTPAIRQERGIQVEEGVLIYEIGAQSQRSTGLQPGDVVFQINRQKVATADDLEREFKAAAGAGAITVWFDRGGSVGRSTFYVQ